MSVPSKHFKANPTVLDDLPNELVGEIFQYLNSVDLVFAFEGLNTRYQDLLHAYAHSFDFRSTRKHLFLHIIHSYDPIRWQSLVLSDGFQTPGQIELFLRLVPPKRDGLPLKSLGMIDTKPSDAKEYLKSISLFNHLVSLSIGPICGADIGSLRLPSLRTLKIQSCDNTESIQNLQLNKLQWTFALNCHHAKHWILPSTLKRLKVVFQNSVRVYPPQFLLKQPLHLKKLAWHVHQGVESFNPLPDGEVWEEIMEKFFPLLKRLEFYYEFCCHHNDLLPKMIRSFSTHFYRVEKCWYFQCDHDQQKRFNLGVLYSLPFPLAELPIHRLMNAKDLSTCPLSDSLPTSGHLYRQVTTVNFRHHTVMHASVLSLANITCLKVFSLNQLIPGNLFPQVTHLQLLTSSEVLRIDMDQVSESMPKLQSLSIPLETLLFMINDSRNSEKYSTLFRNIRALTIKYDIECLPITSINLKDLKWISQICADICEHLSIAVVASPNSVLPLLQTMKNLRSVQCRWDSLCSSGQTNGSCNDDEEKKQVSDDTTENLSTMDLTQLDIWYRQRSITIGEPLLADEWM